MPDLDILAALFVGVAVWLLGARLGLGRESLALPRWWPLAAVVCIGWVVLGLRPVSAAFVVVLAAAGTGVWWLIRRRRAYRSVRATRDAVRAACHDLADDLSAGRLPDDALAAAATRWPGLRPAVIAGELHHDVQGALRDIALTPGAEGLRDVAAAWQVSTRLGSGLADALSQVSRLLASRETRERLMEAELAAARATAMVVSGLPVLVLGMGAGLGTRPWLFFTHGLGVVGLAAGLALLLVGWAWIEGLGQTQGWVTAQ